MKKLLVLFLLPAVLGGWGFAEKLGSLPEVMKPGMIAVSGDQLFVVEGPKIFNISLKDMTLLRTFGRQGEGPGELKVSPVWYNFVAVYPDHLFVAGLDKFIYFSRDGKLLKEIRKPPGIMQAFPVGKHFLVSDQTHMEKDTQQQVLSLYDSSFKKFKELYRQDSSVQPAAKTTEVIMDTLDFQIRDERIYIERSREGFVIDVFDSGGKKLYQIKKDVPKLKVTAADRDAALADFKQDPFVKEVGFENFRKQFSDVVYPKVYPAIRNIDVSKDRIYARTFKRKSGKEECLVMNLKGKVLSTVYLPMVENAPFTAHLVGIRYYTIVNNKYYYLKENEDTEDWELHVEALLKD